MDPTGTTTTTEDNITVTLAKKHGLDVDYARRMIAFFEANPTMLEFTLATKVWGVIFAAGAWELTDDPREIVFHRAVINGKALVTKIADVYLAACMPAKEAYSYATTIVDGLKRNIARNEAPISKPAAPMSGCFAERNAAYLADVAEYKQRGLIVDDAVLEELAARHDVPAARLSNPPTLFAMKNATFLDDVRQAQQLTGKVSRATFERLARAHGIDPSIYEHTTDPADAASSTPAIERTTA